MGRIGIIGGSGLYKIEGLKDTKEVSLNTPFGKPSAKFIIGRLADKEVVFIPRHAIGHRIPPSHINYRANIFGMKKLGVERIISVSACGSLKEEFRPLDFVVVDQFVDRTNYAREMSFFEEGIVVHVEFAHPVCGELSNLLFEAGKSLGLRIHNRGTYINIEGPMFSTLAESNLYRSWGMDVIGMTNFVEAKLAREAEMCYGVLAAVTDYDCWHPAHDSVTAEMVINNLQKNIDQAKRILSRVIKNIPQERKCACGSSLLNAIVTDKKLISAKIKKDLNIIIGKYMK
ncbi:MAG: S-methyl-5'-thioadenosine phosphorylase [Candidatus Omnitrophica bacterium]|nr:S-methyl-5'-thioadenosine phosphorylase [Candidatus Omnitrophota bacterium]MCM8771309.1 S-methyl-5'-thioadenosine phosphorylase [Candidatus Omnitrophota bacterium]